VAAAVEKMVVRRKPSRYWDLLDLHKES
jgi:hypothetical protein